MTGVEKRFLAHTASHLREDHLPKILEAVGLLSDEEVWERPGATSNSVGNLLLHLAGNVRQHIISGSGGQPDLRDRPAEFAATGGTSKAGLLDNLVKTVAEACGVLEALDPRVLLEKRLIQGKEVVLLDDILHVVEHFAYHTGQIISFVKWRKDHRFPWYRHLDRRDETRTS